MRDRKYNFKAKRRKVVEDEERELEESVRTISALLQSGGTSLLPNAVEYAVHEEPLETQVANIRAEIAAAIAQAQSRIYEVDEDEEDGEYGSGADMAVSSTIGPTTSGIRGEEGFGHGQGVVKDIGMIVEDDGEDDDSDAFPIPLRTRRTKEINVAVGSKRKC
jgi:hypothetical protein